MEELLHPGFLNYICCEGKGKDLKQKSSSLLLFFYYTLVNYLNAHNGQQIVASYLQNYVLFVRQSNIYIQWCEERMRLSCSECKEFSNLIGPQSLAAQISLV